jgi:hypothetical protein
MWLRNSDLDRVGLEALLAERDRRTARSRARAAVLARAVSGSAWAAASADASAVDWAARCALYQEPTSMTSADMPISTVRKTMDTTIDCPF